MYVFSVQIYIYTLMNRAMWGKNYISKKEETLWINELYIFLEMSKCDIGYIKKNTHTSKTKQTWMITNFKF